VGKKIAERRTAEIVLRMGNSSKKTGKEKYQSVQQAFKLQEVKSEEVK
jgi:calcineurin-like phosphoesterase family protein